MSTYHVDRNQLAKLLESAGDDSFVVYFQKKINRKLIVDTLEAVDINACTRKELKQVAESMLAGTPRVLVGQLVRAEPVMGRSYVKDLEYTGSYSTRIVDHRTIKRLDLRGNQYILKEL